MSELEQCYIVIILSWLLILALVVDASKLATRIHSLTQENSHLSDELRKLSRRINRNA